jgi:hypothetical protein
VRCEVRGRAQLFDGVEDARGAGMAGGERRGPETAMRWDGAQMEGKQGTRRRGVKKAIACGPSSVQWWTVVRRGAWSVQPQSQYLQATKY